MGKRLLHKPDLVSTVRARRRACIVAAAFWLTQPVRRSFGQDAEPEAAILIAAPRLTGSMFARSVVLVARTPGGETIGLVLNQPTEAELPAELAGPPGDATAARLYRGGPLAPLTIFALAQTESATGAAIKVAAGVYLSAGMTETRRLLEAAVAGPRRVFRGYAGWAPGQLGEEIRAGFWSAREATPALLFDPEPASLWNRLVTPQRGVRGTGGVAGA